jgi:sulfur carrier protein ThiS adenylyltransferase
VLALRESLRAMNPAARITTHVHLHVNARNMTDLFGPCGPWSKPWTRPRTKKLIIETMPRTNRLVVWASGLGGFGRAGHMQVRRLRPNLVVVGDMATTCDPGYPAPVPGRGHGRRHAGRRDPASLS